VQRRVAAEVLGGVEQPQSDRCACEQIRFLALRRAGEAQRLRKRQRVARVRKPGLAGREQPVAGTRDGLLS
jgi:hypothetical protein